MNWDFGLNYGKICVPLAIWLKTTTKHWKIKTNKIKQQQQPTKKQPTKRSDKNKLKPTNTENKKTTLINYKKQKQRNEQNQLNKNGF